MSAATSSRSPATWSRKRSRLEKERRREAVREAARKAAMERLLDALTGKDASEATRESFRQRFARTATRTTSRSRSRSRTTPLDAVRHPRQGGQVGMINLREMMGKAMGRSPASAASSRSPTRWDKLVDEEADKRVDQDDVTRVALADAEANGIVFLDEIDKIAVSDVRGGSVSREGVQRDLLPLIEGTTVATKYGPMKTDHILFIASRRVPHRQAARPAARAAGPPADPRRAEGADRGGLRPHPVGDRAPA